MKKLTHNSLSWLAALVLVSTTATAQQTTNRGSIPATKLVPAPGGAPTTGNPGPTPKLLAKGSQAPEFASLDLAGKTVQLADFKGKVVVLDFWATWCGPCMKSLPHTQEVAHKYKSAGVVVLAVCTSDTRAKYEPWVKANQAKYPDIIFTSDPNERGSANYDDRASKKLYGVQGIPTQLILTGDGKVAETLVGYSEGDARLEAALAKAGVKVDAATAAKGEKQIREDK